MVFRRLATSAIIIDVSMFPVKSNITKYVTAKAITRQITALIIDRVRVSFKFPT